MMCAIRFSFNAEKTCLLTLFELLGNIPTEIGLLQNLEILSLYGNKLQGTIPTEIGRLKNLKTLLLLKGNNLSNLIPIEVCCLKELRTDVKRFCTKEMVGFSGRGGGGGGHGKGGRNSGGGKDGGNSGGGKPDKGFVCV